jgi:excisionase family DNA binding protein
MAERSLKDMTRNNPKKTETSALLTVKEVAALDNCSEKTVRRAIDAGLLQVVRLGPAGRLTRIDPAAHRAYRALLNA